MPVDRAVTRPESKENTARRLIILKKDGRPTNKAKNRRRIIDQYSSFPSMVFPNKPITFERKRMPEGCASLEQQGTRAAGGRVPGWPGMC